MARQRGNTSTGTAPTRSDAYVGLLLISLLAQIAGVVFFYLDYSQYPESKPKVPPALTSAGPAPAPVPVAPVAPGAPAAPGQGQPGAPAVPGGAAPAVPGAPGGAAPMP